MARSVLDRGEVSLNNIKYKLGGDGLVHTFYASQFAQKQVIGDYTKDSDPNRSTWTIYADQSGGIGVEDMRKPSQVNRSWWSTVNTDYPGSGFLGRLATSVTVPAVTAPSITDTGMETWTDVNTLTNWTKTAAILTREATIVHGGTYSAKLSYNSAQEIQQDVFAALYAGRRFTFTCWAYSGTASVARISIYDDVNGFTYSSYVAGNSTWAQLTVTATIAATATQLRLNCAIMNPSTPASDTAYFDDAAITGTTPGNITIKPVEFDGDLYLAQGAVLSKLNTGTGAAFDAVNEFSATITHMFAGVNSCLYVFLGDATNYYYMTTADAWTQTNVANAQFGVHWNNQAIKVNTSGATTYSTTPNAAAPTWTANGTLDTGTWGTIRGLITYADPDGDDTVYAATTKGLLMYDHVTGSGTGLWPNTELQVPDHTDNGKGFIVQNGAIYYSAGLSVYEYKLVNGSLTVTNMGLDLDDGLPDEYVGSITSLFNGYGGDVYALVDASLISSSNFSGVYRYRNGAWALIWADGTANEAMAAGFCSSIYAYRLWFSAANAVSYIPLDRSRRNPLKVSASTYAASGRHISPWFDGEWAGNKLALATRALVRGSSSTETVTLRYRTDKATTDNVASTAGWTLQDTLVAADSGVESVVTFASSVGLSFKTIQFRADFARAAGTTTLTPNLIYAALEYEKLITSKWGWSFVLDCSETYANQTPVQQRDAITTVVESQTLVTFYYGGASEPKYVRVKPAEGQRLSGQGSSGQYSLVAVEK